MKQLLTPRELAGAMGVSESSLRRWVDGGLIPYVRTVGGHRRIRLADAVQYIRSTHAAVVRPELLGLEELAAVPPAQGPAGDDQRVYDALAEGDGPRFESLLLTMYLSGRSLAGIFDGPLRRAMHRVGELWRHDPQGILTEHRALDLAVRVVCELRGLLPQPPADAPLALGGAVENDPYVLPSMMAAAVLEDAGYRAVNLGANTPVALLGDMAEKNSARLAWLSISSAADAERLSGAIDRLSQRLAACNTSLVIGGRLVRDYAAADKPNLHVLQSMGELSAFAAGLKGR